MSTLGVGFVGCGAATQSIHLSAVASLPDLFRVRRCIDPDAAVAATVAARAGAVPGTDLDAVLADDDVEVVVVASPGAVHADQVIAACEAGKRAVLCEKPLAESAADCERVAAASARTGVPVLVATMHRYDPALRLLEDAWDDLPERATLIRSDAFVGPNDRLVSAVTEPVVAAGRPSITDGPSLPGELLTFAALLWGLAIHHLPLIRLAVPGVAELEVIDATATGATGYRVSLRSGSRAVQLTGALLRFPRNEWTFELVAPDRSARVDFAPGYLPTRSATATLCRSAGALEERRFSASNETGYRAQYRHLAAVARGEASPLTPASGAVDDARLIERVIAAAVGRRERR